MRSTDYYRQLSDDELLLHGKEARTYADAFVVALIERYEDTLEDLAAATYREDQYHDRTKDLESQVAELEEQLAAMTARTPK